MPFPLGAAITGGAALLGAGLNYYGQRKANQAGTASAKEQMQFQERMSNTAYQRAMADARSAGLNPLLMGKYGGASTPGGAMFAPDSETSGAVSSAMEARRMYAELENLDAQNKHLDRQSALADAQIRHMDADTLLKMQSEKRYAPLSKGAEIASGIIDNLVESATGRGTDKNPFTATGKWIGKKAFELTHGKK